ncbi:MAG: class I adenylate-forming enzyme family protein [Sphingobium phenoxybenzoativorans]
MIGLTQGMRRALLMRPQGVAILDGDAQFSWAQFADRTARLAGMFKSLGLETGDRVALLALNSHRSLECYFAALHAGGVITPLNHRLSVQEIAAQIADAEPKIIVLGPDFAQFAGELKHASGGTVSAIIHCADGPAPDGMTAYEAALAVAQAVPDAGRGGDDLACLFYTGGTTGAPKGVMLSHANILANSANFISHIGMDERTVHLHCGPLFHVAAGVRLFSVTQAAGTHVVLPRFVAGEVLSVIARHRVTLATFVPTMLRALLDEPEIASAHLSSLRYITYGAAAMPEALLRQVMTRLPDVRFVQSYGMTETSPIATMLGWREHMPEMAAKGLLRSAGRPALLADIAVVDPSGVPVPAGERGEIVVRGPMVMLGYWRQADATAEALRGGWMHTGDIGYLDGDGYLYVVDRLKDVIISGGENVYSQEVENAIAAHPSVQQCAVFGRPDARWGEAVHAVVVPVSGVSIEPQQVIDHCKSMIAGFKCPRSVEVRLTPLPLSGANKILKNELRADLLAREARSEVQA